ncbi:hypothetical protein [Demequina litorisediminis]|uniref:Uncharacterized protein n=1 Tax=Demequina litorisediminis TaxID=1849022 RepID=A0ABQ6IHS9_9MICO|nr:hypothetical protein [Demequina litorisediminis]GMA36951.1 hypothetical protein GCM10025876_31550 [Demequina litorisediminis]
MFEPLIDNYFSGPGVAMLLVVAGIVFWVMVVVSFFSMAINISKMRRELREPSRGGAHPDRA